MSNPTDTLIRAARLAYGESWQRPLAEALAVNLRTIERVAQAHRQHGEYDRPIPPGWMATLATVMTARADAMHQSAAELRTQANERLPVPTGAHPQAQAHPTPPIPPPWPPGPGGHPWTARTGEIN